MSSAKIYRGDDLIHAWRPERQNSVDGLWVEYEPAGPWQYTLNGVEIDEARAKELIAEWRGIEAQP